MINATIGIGFTATNIAALIGTRRGEEGLASGLFNTSRQIGGPIGLAVLLTVANFETLPPTGHQLVQSEQSASKEQRKGLCFLGSHNATGYRNYLYGSIHT